MSKNVTHLLPFDQHLILGFELVEGFWDLVGSNSLSRRLGGVSLSLLRSTALGSILAFGCLWCLGRVSNVFLFDTVVGGCGVGHLDVEMESFVTVRGGDED